MFWYLGKRLKFPNKINEIQASNTERHFVTYSFTEGDHSHGEKVQSEHRHCVEEKCEDFAFLLFLRSHSLCTFPSVRNIICSYPHNPIFLAIDLWFISSEVFSSVLKNGKWKDCWIYSSYSELISFLFRCTFQMVKLFETIVQL